MRDKLQLHDPEQFNYEEEVKSILSSTEEHISVKDIRTELTYRQNGLEPTEDYSLDDIESAVEGAVDEVVSQHQKGELELSKTQVLYKIDSLPPAEIEDTETRYKII